MSNSQEIAAEVRPTLAADLKALVQAQVNQRLEQMFKEADGRLLEMAERARNNAEQRRYMDAKVILRKRREELAKAFNHELTTALTASGEEEPPPPTSDDISFDELRLAKTRSIEESIAVNNIALKVESDNEEPLWEIGRRVEWLAKEGGAAISAKALAPATVCNSFRVGAQSLDLDFQIELVLYRLFESVVAAGLKQVYSDALNLLDQGGVTPALLKRYGVVARPRQSESALPPPGDATGSVPVSPPPGAAADHQRTGVHAASVPTSGSQGGPNPPTGEQPAWATATNAYHSAAGPEPAAPAAPVMNTGGLPALDAGTLNALRSALGQSPAASGATNPAGPSGSTGAMGTTRSMPSAGVVPSDYGDSQLAADLMEVASGRPVAGWGMVQARASVQRADLVGRMFSGILQDQHVPQALKPQLDDLRFEVIKSALSDQSFFVNVEHPLRRLVDELATLAAASRTTGARSIDRLSDMLAMIRTQIQVGAAVVKAAAAAAEPLPEIQAAQFLEDQLVQNRKRRQALIEKARRVAQEEVQLRMAGHEVPNPARPMIASGLTPLLGLRLLRHGIDSDRWRDGVGLLDRVVAALDARPGIYVDITENEALCAEVNDKLLQAGMLAERTRELMAGLRHGLEAAEIARRAPQPTVEMQVLEAEAAAETAEAPVPDRPDELLQELLVPGVWFKVHDRNRNEKRWLKVDAFYLGDERPDFRDRAAFSEFSGKNSLLVPVDDLLEDIAAGVTEPFDQSPGARSTLAELVKVQLARATAKPDLAL